MMRDAARIGYAQARVQARFGARPADAFWRELEAGRELPHLLEVVRASPLAGAVESVPAGVDPHALEAGLRRRWAGVVDEVAGWYPQPVRPAFGWLAWLAWLPGLAWLAEGRPATGWMTEDPLIRALAAAAPGERALQLQDGPLAPFADAFEAASASGVTRTWHTHWRQTWPPLGAQSHRGLEQLDAALARIAPGDDAGPRPGFDALVADVEAVATRLFRRHAGSCIAGLAFLILLRLDHLRLGAALVTARLFGEARAP